MKKTNIKPFSKDMLIYLINKNIFNEKEQSKQEFTLKPEDKETKKKNRKKKCC